MDKLLHNKLGRGAVSDMEGLWCGGGSESSSTVWGKTPGMYLSLTASDSGGVPGIGLDPLTGPSGFIFILSRVK